MTKFASVVDIICWSEALKRCMLGRDSTLHNRVINPLLDWETRIEGVSLLSPNRYVNIFRDTDRVACCWNVKEERNFVVKETHWPTTEGTLARCPP